MLLADVKTFINRPLEDTFWDTETKALISVAVKAIETYLNTSIAPCTYVGTALTLDPRERLVCRPFLSVERVEWVDDATGAVATVDPATYLVLPEAQATGSIEIEDGRQWPTAARRADAFRVTVKTGFVGFDGLTFELPDDLLHALKMTVAALDSNRGDGGGGGGDVTVYALKNVHAHVIPEAARALLAPYKWREIVVA